MITHALFDTGGRHRVIMDIGAALPTFVIQRRRKYLGWRNIARSHDFSACMFVAGRLEWPRDQSVRESLRRSSDAIDRM